MSLITERSNRQQRPAIASHLTTESVLEESLICLICSTGQLEIKDGDTAQSKAETCNLCKEHGYDGNRQEKEFFCIFCYEKRRCKKGKARANLKRRNTMVEESVHGAEGSLKKMKICGDTQARSKMGAGQS